MQKITPALIRSSFDSGSLLRGQDYYRRGKIVEWQLLPTGKTIARASINGSAQSPYQVVLKLADLKNFNAGLISDCSCPVGFNCKHGAALAFAVMNSQYQAATVVEPGPSAPINKNRPTAKASIAEDINAKRIDEQKPAKRKLKPKPEPKANAAKVLDLWLANTQAQLRTLETPTALKRVPMLWLKNFPDSMYITAAVAEPAVKGGWRQVTRVNSFSYLDMHSWGDKFAAFANLLFASGGAGKLEGSLGAALLKQLPPICHLCYGPDYRPLGRGPTRRLNMAWREENREFVVNFSVDELASWQLVPVDPPYYFDPQTDQLGPLDTTFSGPELDRLVSLPPIPVANSRPIWLRLCEIFGRDALQLPVEIPFEHISQPSPQLVAGSLELPEGGHLPVAYWQLAYGPWVLNPAALQAEPLEKKIDRDGLYYALRRNFQAETRALLSLEQAGIPALNGRLPRGLQTEGNNLPVLVPPGCTSLNEYLSRWPMFVQQLEALGWQWLAGEGYEFKALEGELLVSAEDATGGWFDLALDLKIDGNIIPSAHLVERWLAEDCPQRLWLSLADGSWVEVDCQVLKPLANVLSELSQEKSGSYRLAPFFAALLDDSTEVRRAPKLRQLRQQLRNFNGLRQLPAPKHLDAELRPYQLEGFNWLMFLHQYGFGGILADDMGLGKTLQTLALLQQLKNSRKLARPALIVAPTSLLGNWQAEAAKFTPRLKTLIIHGSDRGEFFSHMAQQDLIITTYGLLHRDLDIYKTLDLSLLILDEAQNIKNANTLAGQAAREINAPLKLALTGTPLENHLGELWAIMDFALPGLLGGLTSFGRRFRTPIEKHGDSEAAAMLAQRVVPFMLRRTKNAVAKELPNKTTITQYVELEGKQRQLYESIRLSMQKRVRELLATKGLAKSRIEFLDALLKLRQACIDPRLVKLAKTDKIKERAKLEWLQQTLPEMIEEGRKILVFSQFTSMLELVAEALNKAGIAYCQLTGKTLKRQVQIDNFQQGDTAIFLISLKAGGSGLNLTAADVVIHLDPWWNPAVENQATDRAYRIGQDKPVFVYKLVAKGTVEEKIQAMQASKQALADRLFDDTQKAPLPQAAEDLLALFA